jgi:hypothetical protein
MSSNGVLPAFRTFDEFSASLSTFLRPLNGARASYEELLGFRQGKLLTRAYVTAFDRLRSRVSDVLPDGFLMHLFMRGLREDLQPSIALQQPANLATACSLAISLADAQMESVAKPGAGNVAGVPAKSGKGSPGSSSEECTLSQGGA